MSDDDLMDFFTEVDESNFYEPVKAPFKWVGGKTKSLDRILPHLPRRDVYVEPFGGSMAVLLARSPVKVEVYNDRYSGLVDFYKCLRDPNLYEQLIDRLELTCYSRELFTIEKRLRDSAEDPVIRAAAWYYIQEVSFGAVGRCYGRGLKTGPSSFRDKIPLFPLVHERIKKVQIENMDWLPILKDWDSPDTVFYIDPPYVGTDCTMYKGGDHWTVKDLHDLLRAIFNCVGFVALSGYPQTLIDALPWDERLEWEVAVTVSSTQANERNNRSADSERSKSTEVLWIKK